MQTVYRIAVRSKVFITCRIFSSKRIHPPKCALPGCPLPVSPFRRVCLLAVVPAASGSRWMGPTAVIRKGSGKSSKGISPSAVLGERGPGVNGPLDSRPSARTGGSGDTPAMGIGSADPPAMARSQMPGGQTSAKGPFRVRSRDRNRKSKWMPMFAGASYSRRSATGLTDTIHGSKRRPYANSTS